MTISCQRPMDLTQLSWKKDIDNESSLPTINWEVLKETAIRLKQRLVEHDRDVSCQLSAEYNLGGVHVVRRLDFNDGTHWLARLRLHKEAHIGSCEGLEQEVFTTQVVRERSMIPVPEVFGYDASWDNAVGVPFMLLEFIPADTAMDSFGGYEEHGGSTPPQFKADYFNSLAKIQVDLSAIRFPMIGSIIKLSDGTYTVGPLPDIGGPFATAAEFFCAWAANRKFPFSEEWIRNRTQSQNIDVDAIIKSIKEFPAQLVTFAKHHQFRSGPFPVIHTDFYKSNVLIDSEYRVQGVIDWENAMVGPWEVVEFPKDLSIVPPVMDGPFYRENASSREMMADRKRYVEVVRSLEEAKQLDSSLSQTLDDWATQNLAHAIWLHPDGRIGFYSDIFNLFS